ncbi:OpgC domain-containing protein [Tardiphaga sp. vice352]|uniref:OpgC domain-containing protein n=1 Tax=unclassified Tardiphaga TaxID=2631404 RepID=UPI001161FE74|nr:MULTISPECIES: OpgC domain-containing protein [unclassified Tardiphaga]QDM17316.1 OpgC domain-containing protein [Tardiphaga sp. vice278]QDM22290.1 OpgC domain-containing protein [Tardiphaga sp. vice154]QDM27552.1 OpgC domain-containing protein [Tardiphaga sp. vice304]QDM32690.1 OpgC domain-containing protein [Tardiphaga sp. vice352]
MEINATLPPKGRDLRLDLFRGIANWAIFLDHIPDNVVNWVTTRNYGFSDAADLFVFISGYTASFVYAKMMLERGFIVGATRLFKRVWQLYVAHVILFVIYIAAIGYVAQRYNDPDIINEFNVAGLVDNPIQTLSQGLLLKFKPLNLDVLPLYVILMGFFPPVLWLMLRKPDLTMLGSLALYFAARQFGWNLSAYPSGEWYFNPYTWQLLFVFGAWFALGGAVESRSVIKSKVLLYFGVAYLLFSLVMTMAGRFPDYGHMMPDWLFDAFNPNDKTNLAPYRVLHFVIIAFFVTRFVPKEWRGLEWRVFQPLIKCGQQSLAVFCVGVFLSFVGHFLLMMSSGSLASQIFVSAAGLALMTLVAYYISWSKKQDKPLPKPAAAVAPATTTSATSASATTDPKQG